MKTLTFYVDFDGTLACASLDDCFKDLCSQQGFDNVIDWYRSCEVDDLPLNLELIAELYELKAQGHKIVLWTNRGLGNKAMTKRNLGTHWDLFDEYQFHAGMKSKCELDGVVYDNEERYLACGTYGRLFHYKPTAA